MNDLIDIICPTCKHIIDPDVCWCGNETKNHTISDNHSPIPMGCICGYNKKLVVHCKKEPYDVYIGRPSKWGNPYTHIKDKTTKAEFIVKTRKEAIEKYREYLLNNKQLMLDLHELEGKVLGCWCKPAACHGDVLIELLNYEQLDKRLWMDSNQ
jgi:hypothetical protein